MPDTGPEAKKLLSNIPALMEYYGVLQRPAPRGRFPGECHLTGDMIEKQEKTCPRLFKAFVFVKFKTRH